MLPVLAVGDEFCDRALREHAQQSTTSQRTLRDLKPNIMSDLQPEETLASKRPSEAGIAEVANLVAAGEMADAVLALDRLSPESQADAVASLTPEMAAELVEHVVEASAVEIIDHLPANVAALILDEVASDHRVDLIAELSEPTASQIIDQMDPEEAEDARSLMRYAWDTAGGLMVTATTMFNTLSFATTSI